MLHRICFFTIALLAFTSLHAQQIPATGASLNSFVPKDWIIFTQATGDLNKDSIADVVMIIQGTDKKKIVRNEEMGKDTLDLNPRMLLVLFKQADSSYRMAAKNTAFMPTPDNLDNPCVSDPLDETDALTVKKGVFTFCKHYWSSCGSYGTSTEDYVFRYQNGKFELIGYTSENMDRSSGEMIDYSVNFSTRKTVLKTGENMFYDTKEKPKTVQTSFTIRELLNLETITPEAFDNALPSVKSAK